MPAAKPINVTAEKLREILDYNAQTGEFRWKISPAPSVRVGDKAGYMSTQGGQCIMIDYKPLAAARLAWLYVHGEVPTGIIRHKNGDKTDNRIENLQAKIDPNIEMEDLSLERLRSDLRYEPNEGHFYWNRARPGPARVDADGVANRAGVKRADGYVIIGYLARKYLAHRLAWFYVHGVWPPEIIDHINGNRGDNRIVNLREAKHFENGQNRAIKSTNTTGVTGVYRVGKRWYARATVNNMTHTVGYFSTKEEAAKAREKLIAEHIGDFARKG